MKVNQQHVAWFYANTAADLQEISLRGPDGWLAAARKMGWEPSVADVNCCPFIGPGWYLFQAGFEFDRLTHNVLTPADALKTLTTLMTHANKIIIDYAEKLKQR